MRPASRLHQLGWCAREANGVRIFAALLECVSVATSDEEHKMASCARGWHVRSEHNLTCNLLRSHSIAPAVILNFDCLYAQHYPITPSPYSINFRSLMSVVASVIKPSLVDPLTIQPQHCSLKGRPTCDSHIATIISSLKQQRATINPVDTSWNDCRTLPQLQSVNAEVWHTKGSPKAFRAITLTFWSALGTRRWTRLSRSNIPCCNTPSTPSTYHYLLPTLIIYRPTKPCMHIHRISR